MTRPTNIRRVAAAVAASLIAAACSDSGDIVTLPDQLPAERSTTTTLPPDIDGPNVLLVVVDDVGVDVAPCYGADAVSAPTIEQLCKDGVVFEQVWSMPASSPTRATILTGRFGLRTGIGDNIQREALPINDNELTLPRAIDAVELPHETAQFGKWHLGATPDLPRLMGWDYFSGFGEGDIASYFAFTKTVNTGSRAVEGYVTTDQIDDTVDWISHRDRLPWLVWLGTSAPQAPFHLPPAELHSFGDLPDDPDTIEADPRPYYDAAIQALDTELARLLDSLEPQVREQTTVVITSDGGSPNELHPVELDEDGEELPGRHKGTLYQGGIHVPLIISGAGVTDGGRRTEALVHTVDLFATVLELLGTNSVAAVPDSVEIDSVSLVPVLQGASDTVRVRLYSEIFGESFTRSLDGAALRDERYKVIRWSDTTVEAYDLQADPDEEAEIYATADGDLRQRLDGLLGELDALIPFDVVDPDAEDADADAAVTEPTDEDPDS